MPNFDFLSFMMKFPSLKLIWACSRETDMSVILISDWKFLPIFIPKFYFPSIKCRHLSSFADFVSDSRIMYGLF